MCINTFDLDGMTRRIAKRAQDAADTSMYTFDICLQELVIHLSSSLGMTLLFENPSERIPSQGQRAAVWEGSGKLERILQSGYLLKDIGQLSGKDQGSWSESFRADTISRTTGSCLGRIREAGANPSERIPSQGQWAAVWEGSGKLE